MRIDKSQAAKGLMIAGPGESWGDVGMSNPFPGGVDLTALDGNCIGLVELWMKTEGEGFSWADTPRNRELGLYEVGPTPSLGRLFDAIARLDADTGDPVTLGDGWRGLFDMGIPKHVVEGHPVKFARNLPLDAVMTQADYMAGEFEAECWSQVDVEVDNPCVDKPRDVDNGEGVEWKDTDPVPTNPFLAEPMREKLEAEWVKDAPPIFGIPIEVDDSLPDGSVVIKDPRGVYGSICRCVITPDPPQPTYEYTTWLRAEIDGRIVESPLPEGDGWEETEGHEWDRGQARMVDDYEIESAFGEVDFLVSPLDCRENLQCWIHDYGPIIVGEESPILGVKLYRREILPDPDPERYQTHYEFL
ncbi:MAG: hypothetical protein GY851_07310 [bacterium]|nr:hypothetical protein [bacterium]